MKNFSRLTVKPTTTLSFPDQHTQEFYLDSPAISVMTDFQRTQPVMIEFTAKADELIRLMKKEHVKLKLVVDAEETFIGVVTTDDLAEQEFIRHSAKGFEREELLVKDFMIPKHALHAFSYSEISKATVRDLLHNLRDYERQHFLIVDEGANRIRGIISASDICRKLKIEIDLFNNSNFSNIAQMIVEDHKHANVA
ncbi:CBS domain-containing protein [Marinomonas sp. 15G1-11]|uniref:CBS domain-containing protein n=1 Tax=Marinomonas phaeophyticola TaxID=3004091 RepID=A0ABT4JYJ2_9GAMM|nr:CBS domain-containing protein [Marinomonas sp. 15G1-11]MCZ2723458.1 CBS domain-containing protein [Marinomonas sp. 15G1-11]